MAEFNPSPGDKIALGPNTYHVSAHPAVPTFAFGQEGRKAFVFQLAHSKRHKLYALKKFKEAFRHAELDDICRSLAQFAHLPGMGVCRRVCLTSPDYANVLREYPDLEFSVLMPWMHGSTWYDLVVGQTELDYDSSLQMAWKTSLVLTGLEEAGLAHCDIAGPNIIIDMDAGEVHLVDVEDMYAPGLDQPQAVPAGTDGYNHLTADAGQWSPEADRFAGAVLLAEMLGWHDPAVRERSDEEHYFAVRDMQQDGDAFQLLHATLVGMKPALGDLFERAWFAPTFADCPPLAEWTRVLDPMARPSPVTEWVSLDAKPVPAAPHPGTWEDVQAAPDAPAAPAPQPAPVSVQPPADSLPPVQVPRQPAQPLDPDGPVIEFRPIVVPPQPEAPPAPTPITPPTPEPEPLPAEARPIEAPLQEARPSPVSETQSLPEPEPAPPPPPVPVEDVGAEPLPEEPPAVPPASESEDRNDSSAMPIWLADIGRRFRIARLRDNEAPAPPDVADVVNDEVSEEAPPATPEQNGQQPESDPLPAHQPLRIEPPSPPTLSVIGPAEDSSYVVVWDEVPDATHYVLQESTRMAFSDGSQADGLRTTRWHVNERPPGTYYYRVRAHTDDDFSEWSNIVYVRVGSQETANTEANPKPGGDGDLTD